MYNSPPYPHSHQEHSSSSRAYSHAYSSSPLSTVPPSISRASAQQRDMTINPNPRDVPAVVHALLLSTRQLQGALQRWSTGQAEEAEVSDVYVQIGTQFNETIHAFAGWGIDLSDIHSIPTELRTVLEQCLAEDPSPNVVIAFMPAVRKVLYKLLKGLQAKQDAWRSLSGAASSPTLSYEGYM